MELNPELWENPRFTGLFQTSGAQGHQNGPAVAPYTPRPAPQIEDSTAATPTIIPQWARLVPVLSIRSQQYIIHQHHSTTLILILILILMYISQMSATMIQTTNYCRYCLSDKALKCQYQINYLMAGRSSKMAVVTLTNMWLTEVMVVTEVMVGDSKALQPTRSVMWPLSLMAIWPAVRSCDSRRAMIWPSPSTSPHMEASGPSSTTTSGRLLPMALLLSPCVCAMNETSLSQLHMKNNTSSLTNMAITSFHPSVHSKCGMETSSCPPCSQMTW